MPRLVYKRYTANGTWVAPAGVTRVILIGQGSGSGGQGGGTTAATHRLGGHATVPTMTMATVVPNTSYSITIAAGGAGGAAGSAGSTGTIGSSTTFGALATFPGASRHGIVIDTLMAVKNLSALSATAWMSGGLDNAQTGKERSSGGTAGNYSSTYAGGMGGSPGYGAGGTGGDGNSSGAGGNGGNGTYGGGGGAGGNGSSNGGSGGTGGPGQLWVCWVE